MSSAKTAKAKQASAASRVRIRLVHSPIGCSYRHKATLRALGLRRLNQVVEQADSSQLRGMLSKVAHLVRVEPLAGRSKEKTS